MSVSQNQNNPEEFKQKVQQIIDQYKKLKEDYSQLQEQYSAKEAELMKAHKDLLDLRSDYESLKIAKAFAITEADKKEAYLKISRLVREVDDCISFLNE